MTDLEHKRAIHAVRGDIIRVLNIVKLKAEYRGATGEVMNWHYGDIYTVLINGHPCVLTGHEFNVTYPS